MIVLGAERRIGRPDVIAAEPLDVVLECPDGASTHFIVGADKEVAFAGDVLDQPVGQCVRLHECIGVHTEYVRIALRTGDRRRVRHSSDQDALVALRKLADRKGRSAVDGPGQQIDFILLEKFLRLSHRHRRVRLFVLKEQLEHAAFNTASRVDLLDGELGAPTNLLANWRVGAGQRRYNTDLDRVGGLRVRRQDNCQSGASTQAKYR